MSGPEQDTAPLTVGVCEDDPAIARVIAESLQRGGHRVIGAASSREAMQRFASESAIGVLVLDIGLPDGDGRDLCRALRANGQAAPVLFLTALGATHDLVEGFNAGGSDYLVKPFAIPELIARVEALSRRPVDAAPPTGLELDPAGYRLRTPVGERLLTPTEFRIAAALLGRPGHVLRRTELVNAAWVPGARVQGNTLDSYIYRLRRHLQDLGSDKVIDTVRGVGYVLK